MRRLEYFRWGLRKLKERSRLHGSIVGGRIFHRYTPSCHMGVNSFNPVVIGAAPGGCDPIHLLSTRSELDVTPSWVTYISRIISMAGMLVKRTLHMR